MTRTLTIFSLRKALPADEKTCQSGAATFIQVVVKKQTDAGDLEAGGQAFLAALLPALKA